MTLTIKRKVGQTLPTICGIISDRTGPVSLASYTVKFLMQAEIGGAVKVAETPANVTKEPTQPFTASTSTSLLSRDNHGVKEGQQIIVASSGSLPTPLAAATRYFAVNVGENDFQLATRAGGPAIPITNAGSGNTFYVVGSVQYAQQAADMDTAGRFKAWFKGYTGSDFLAAPVQEDLIVEISAFS